MDRAGSKSVSIAIPLLLVVGMVGIAAGQNPSSRGPSTLEERQRFVQVTHRLESNPLDPSLEQDREWALRWLVEVPDVHASLCSGVLGDFVKEKKYKYSSDILRQQVFSGAAFTIENPDKARDVVAQYEAGVAGALVAYQSILKQHPEAHSKSLDGLLQKQTDGKLGDFIRESANKNCKS